MDVDSSKIKTANEKSATVLNLARIVKLLAGKLTFNALDASLRLTKDSFKAKAYERVILTAKETTEAQSRREAEESSNNAVAAHRPEGKIVRDTLK